MKNNLKRIEKIEKAFKCLKLYKNSYKCRGRDSNPRSHGVPDNKLSTALKYPMSRAL